MITKQIYKGMSELIKTELSHQEQKDFFWHWSSENYDKYLKEFKKSKFNYGGGDIGDYYCFLEEKFNKIYQLNITI